VTAVKRTFCRPRVIYARERATDQQFAMIGHSGDRRETAAGTRDATTDWWCPLLSLVVPDGQLCRLSNAAEVLGDRGFRSPIILSANQQTRGSHNALKRLWHHVLATTNSLYMYICPFQHRSA